MKSKGMEGPPFSYSQLNKAPLAARPNYKPFSLTGTSNRQTQTRQTFEYTNQSRLRSPKATVFRSMNSFEQRCLTDKLKIIAVQVKKINSM